MSALQWKKLLEELLDWNVFDVTKLFVTAFIIVLVTKVQVVNDRLSALLIALPITSLLAMLWMKGERQSNEQLANHAEGTFWFVLPTLPMFLVLPWMLRSGWGFGVSLLSNILLTVALFWLLVWVLRKVGMPLL